MNNEEEINSSFEQFLLQLVSEIKDNISIKIRSKPEFTIKIFDVNVLETYFQEEVEFNYNVIVTIKGKARILNSFAQILEYQDNIPVLIIDLEESLEDFFYTDILRDLFNDVISALRETTKKISESFQDLEKIFDKYFLGLSDVKIGLTSNNIYVEQVIISLKKKGDYLIQIGDIISKSELFSNTFPENINAQRVESIKTERDASGTITGISVLFQESEISVGVGDILTIGSDPNEILAISDVVYDFVDLDDVFFRGEFEELLDAVCIRDVFSNYCPKLQGEYEILSAGVVFKPRLFIVIEIYASENYYKYVYHETPYVSCKRFKFNKKGNYIVNIGSAEDLSRNAYGFDDYVFPDQDIPLTSIDIKQDVQDIDFTLTQIIDIDKSIIYITKQGGAFSLNDRYVCKNFVLYEIQESEVLRKFSKYLDIEESQRILNLLESEDEIEDFAIMYNRRFKETEVSIFRECLAQAVMYYSSNDDISGDIKREFGDKISEYKQEVSGENPTWEHKYELSSTRIKKLSDLQYEIDIDFSLKSKSSKEGLVVRYQKGQRYFKVYHRSNIKYHEEAFEKEFDKIKRKYWNINSLGERWGDNVILSVFLDKPSSFICLEEVDSFIERLSTIIYDYGWIVEDGIYCEELPSLSASLKLWKIPELWPIFVGDEFRKLFDTSVPISVFHAMNDQGSYSEDTLVKRIVLLKGVESNEILSARFFYTDRSYISVGKGDVIERIMADLSSDGDIDLEHFSMIDKVTILTSRSPSFLVFVKSEELPAPFPKKETIEKIYAGYASQEVIVKTNLRTYKFTKGEDIEYLDIYSWKSFGGKCIDIIHEDVSLESAESVLIVFDSDGIIDTTIMNNNPQPVIRLVDDARKVSNLKVAMDESKIEFTIGKKKYQFEINGTYNLLDADGDIQARHKIIAFFKNEMGVEVELETNDDNDTVDSDFSILDFKVSPHNGKLWDVTIAEEEHLDDLLEEIEDQETDIETLQKAFEEETGKNAIWRGKRTKAFEEWLEKQEKDLKTSLNEEDKISEIINAIIEGDSERIKEIYLEMAMEHMSEDRARKSLSQFLLDLKWLLNKHKNVEIDTPEFAIFSKKVKDFISEEISKNIEQKEVLESTPEKEPAQPQEAQELPEEDFEEDIFASVDMLEEGDDNDNDPMMDYDIPEDIVEILIEEGFTPRETELGNGFVNMDEFLMIISNTEIPDHLKKELKTFIEIDTKKDEIEKARSVRTADGKVYIFIGRFAFLKDLVLQIYEILGDDTKFYISKYYLLVGRKGDLSAFLTPYVRTIKEVVENEGGKLINKGRDIKIDLARLLEPYERFIDIAVDEGSVILTPIPRARVFSKEERQFLDGLYSSLGIESRFKDNSFTCIVSEKDRKSLLDAIETFYEIFGEENNEKKG